MELNCELFQLEVEQFVDVEVAAMDKKVKEHIEKKTKVKPTNSDLSIAFPNLEKWLEVFEGFMRSLKYNLLFWIRRFPKYRIKNTKE